MKCSKCPTEGVIGVNIMMKDAGLVPGLKASHPENHMRRYIALCLACIKTETTDNEYKRASRGA